MLIVIYCLKIVGDENMQEIIAQKYWQLLKEIFPEIPSHHCREILIRCNLDLIHSCIVLNRTFYHYKYNRFNQEPANFSYFPIEHPCYNNLSLQSPQSINPSQIVPAINRMTAPGNSQREAVAALMSLTKVNVRNFSR